MLELINSRLIEENDSVLIVVYAVNQKGKSLGVVVRDFELGATQNIDKGKRKVRESMGIYNNKKEEIVSNNVFNRFLVNSTLLF
jgi:hypothetical protein